MYISVADKGVVIRNTLEKDDLGIDKIEIVIEQINFQGIITVREALILKRCLQVFFSKGDK
jgi:hypothetical protein